MFMSVINLLTLTLSIFKEYQRTKRAAAIRSVKTSVKKMSNTKVVSNLKGLMNLKKKG